MSRFLVLASANRDLFVRLDRMAKPGETLYGSDYGFAVGGKGCNAAVAVARQGAEVSVIGRIGNDDNGRAILAALDREALDTRAMSVSGTAPTGFAVCTVEADGNSRILVFPGANTELTFDAGIVGDTRYDAFMTQLEAPFDAVASGVEWARERNIPSIVDAGPARAGLELERLHGVTIFSPNETETEILTGMKTDSEFDCREAARALFIRIQPKFVVLKLGARGCYIFGEGIEKLLPAVKVNAIDATAAGDSFTGALALKYLETGDIEASAKYAAYAGALATLKIGAMPSLPTLDEIEGFIKEKA